MKKKEEISRNWGELEQRPWGGSRQKRFICHTRREDDHNMRGGWRGMESGVCSDRSRKGVCLHPKSNSDVHQHIC